MRFSLRPTAAQVRSGTLDLRAATGFVVMVLLPLIAFVALVHPTPRATAGADKPLWKEKGKPTGTIQGGTGGQPFKDRAWGRLAQIAVRGGSWLDSVRCSWDDEGEIVKGDTHGGDGGEETVVKLEPGEALIQVSGVLLEQNETQVIGSLSFKTTKRTIGPVGKTLDGPRFTLDAPSGQEICGFQGRSGDYLSAIGMVCRPRP